MKADVALHDAGSTCAKVMQSVADARARVAPCSGITMDPAGPPAHASACIHDARWVGAVPTEAGGARIKSPEMGSVATGGLEERVKY